MFYHKYRVLLVILISILHLTCKKSILDVNKDYEGYWYSESGCPLIIEIDASSFANLYEHKSYDVCGYSYQGKACIRKDNLKIAGVRFKVIEPPTNIDTIYNYRYVGWHAVAKMVLQSKGVKGVKIGGERVFYKLIFS
mgnify:FL=1